MINNQNPASFRDPAAFVYKQDESIFRKINPEYKNEFNHLLDSGLYKELSEKNYLIAHTLISKSENGYQIIKPEEIPFISYAYEWGFDQIKDAALLTLKIQNIALKYNMSLKDASIYNIQFKNGKPIFIDTTSFEFYDGSFWKAYYQFCKHFLYPLWIMCHNSPKMNSLYLSHLDGLEPKLVKDLLPFSINFKLSVILHLWMPLLFSKRKQHQDPGTLPKGNQKRLIKHLFNTINNLKLHKQKSTWNHYYDESITSQEYLNAKENVIKEIFSKISPGVVLDLGANDGHFSKLINNAEYIISTDFDCYVINDHYLDIKKNNRSEILPLIVDVSNPSPGIGWNNQERPAFFIRKDFDTVMALALIHHLVFSENITMCMIAKKLSLAKKYLIIEFIPIVDDKIKQITKNRQTSHIMYSETVFENCFATYFDLKDKYVVPSSERIIYLYERKT